MHTPACNEERLDEVTRSRIAHDFSNLLLAIRLSLETIDELGSSEAARLARHAIAAVDRAAALADVLAALEKSAP